MTHYRYRALNANGKAIYGMVDAHSMTEARRTIRLQGLIPLTLKLQRQAISPTPRQTSWFTGFSHKALTLMVRQLATLANAKLSADQMLDAVYQQTDNKRLKQALNQVRLKLTEGFSLADAMRTAPHVFSPLFCASVEAGEASGNLSAVLLRLADHLERQHAIKSKMTQAMLYPAIMLCVSLILTSFLLMYVVPKIVALFQSQTLPPLTQVVIAISNHLRHHALFLSILTCCAIISTRYALKMNTHLRKRLDKWFLHLPLVASLIRNSDTSQYLSTLALLCQAGVPIIASMRAATQVIKNDTLKQVIGTAVTDINQGSSLSQALTHTHCFSPMAIQLIANGEISGELTQMLQRTANIQDEELKTTIDTALTVCEPLMIVVMGGIVLTIMLAVLLPIFDLQQIAM